MKKLEQVLDIDPQHATKLREMGIRNVRDLVKFANLEEISMRTGIPPELIQEWNLVAKETMRASRYRRMVAVGIVIFALGVLSLAIVRSLRGNPYSQAEKLFDNGDYAGAARVLDKALARKESAPLHNLRGLVYLYKGQPDYDSALREFERAESLDSNYKFPYVGKAIVFGRMGRYDDALAAVGKAISLDPEYSLAYTERGTIYHDYLFKYDEAYNDAEKAHVLEPGRVAYTANLAEAVLSTSDFEQAEHLAGDLLAEDSTTKALNTSDKLAMHFVVITALLMQAKTDQARPQLEEFVEYYKGIGPDFKNEWIYSGTRNFVVHSVIEKSSKSLLLQLVDLLEQRPQVSIEQVESSISALR